MADIKTFRLPDLGEGLPDATIVEWRVKEGDTVKLDAPLCAMETAKAVVDVPSPYTGKIIKLHGAPGDVIETGAELVDFEPDPNAKQRAEGSPSGHGHGAKKPSRGAGAPTSDPADSPQAVIVSDEGGSIEETGKPQREDEGTVVGAMASSNTVHVEQAASIGNVKAVPAVRALARKLKVDLGRVRPSGAGGVVTMHDVKQAAANGTAPAGGAPAAPIATAAHAAAPAPAPAARTAVSQAGRPMRTAPPS